MDTECRTRTALITGGSRGIGLATAIKLSLAGMRVAICGRNRDALETAASQVREETGREPLTLAADCTSWPEVQRMADCVISEYGVLDVLVNCLAGPSVAGFIDLEDADWMTALNGKLMGQIRCCRAVLPHMLKTGDGRIINVVGTHGHQPTGEVLPAAVVNAGLQSFSKGLAEVGAKRNVLVNVVNPGPIDTERMAYLVESRAESEQVSATAARSDLERATLLERFGRAEEVAAAIAFLASPEATYVTGATINVDGGQTRSL